MDNKEPFNDRRQYKRINRSYILKYFDITDPTKKFEITQLKNISLGGICFPASKNIEVQTTLGIELKAPYFAEFVYLEGIVLECKEKIKGMMFEVRLQFNALDPKAEYVLANMIKFGVFCLF